MFVELNAGLALYSSTDFHTFTAVSLVIPVASSNFWRGPSVPYLIAGKWYLWTHGTCTSGSGDCIERLSATAITGPWTDTGVTELHPETLDEGAGTSAAQVADPYILQNPEGTKTFLYYTASQLLSGNWYQVTKLAVADMPMASLVLTTGGDNLGQIDNPGMLGLSYDYVNRAISFNGYSMENLGSSTFGGGSLSVLGTGGAVINVGCDSTSILVPCNNGNSQINFETATSATPFNGSISVNPNGNFGMTFKLPRSLAASNIGYHFDDPTGTQLFYIDGFNGKATTINGTVLDDGLGNMLISPSAGNLILGTSRQIYWGNTSGETIFGDSANVHIDAAPTSGAVYESGNASGVIVGWRPTLSGSIVGYVDTSGNVHASNGYCIGVSCITAWPGGGGSAFSGGLGASYQDVTEIAAPSNPASGNDRLYTDSSTHLLACRSSSGGSCMPIGGSGTINAAAQYDYPYYSAAGTVQTLSGVAISGFQYDSTTGAPAAATATQLGTLINIPQYSIALGGGTTSALTDLVTSSTAGEILASGGSSANPAYDTHATLSNGALSLGAAGTAGSIVLGGSSSGTSTINTSSTGTLQLPSGTTATSMSLTTPVLGTPTSGTITNLTGTCTSCTSNATSAISGMTTGQVGIAGSSTTITSSIAYATANTASTLVERDSSNNINSGTVAAGATTPTTIGSNGVLLNGVPALQAQTSLNNYYSGGAGNLTGTGVSNTANGLQALYANTTGGYNTASGQGALFSNTTGGTNTAFGFQALYSNTRGQLQHREWVRGTLLQHQRLRQHREWDLCALLQHHRLLQHREWDAGAPSQHRQLQHRERVQRAQRQHHRLRQHREWVSGGAVHRRWRNRQSNQQQLSV